MNQNVSPPAREQKKQETRQRIKSAAADLFIAEGFDRTSMDRIAKHAGVTKRTVYSHFRNKDDLFQSCIIGKVEQYELILDANSPLSLEQGLERFGDGYLKLVSDERVMALWRFLIGQARTHQSLVNTFYESGPGATTRSLARFLEVHASSLAVESYEEAAKTFIALVLAEYNDKVFLALADKVTDSERTHAVRRAIERFLVIFRRAG